MSVRPHIMRTTRDSPRPSAPMSSSGLPIRRGVKKHLGHAFCQVPQKNPVFFHKSVSYSFVFSLNVFLVRACKYAVVSPCCRPTRREQRNSWRLPQGPDTLQRGRLYSQMPSPHAPFGPSWFSSLDEGAFA